MKNLSILMRRIYLPYLLTTVGFIAVYTLLHWLLIINLKLFDVDEEWLDIFIPGIIACLITFILVRPYFRILKVENTPKFRPRNFYYLIVAGSMFIPAIIAQSYMEEATGKLTELHSVSDAGKFPHTKYYTLHNSFADKNNVIAKTKVSADGKYNEYLNFDLYVLTPLLDTSSDTTGKAALCWIGSVYHRRVSNRLSNEKKKTAYDQFLHDSKNWYDTIQLTRFTYLEIAPNNDKRGVFYGALKDANLSPEEIFLFNTHNDDFNSRTGNKLFWVIMSFLICAVLMFIGVLIPKPTADQPAPDVKEQRKFKRKIALKFITPRPNFFFAPLIFWLNVIVFIVMVCYGLGFTTFQASDLLRWGANYGPYVRDGQWWRLITCMFLHGGIMHLAFNLYGLIFVSIFLEPFVGSSIYGVVYLLSGIAASITSALWHPVVGVGASGAIMGLYGFFLILLLTKVYAKEIVKVFLLNTALFIGINLLYGMSGGIDNAAHIGGLVAGAVMGLILTPKLKRKTSVLSLDTVNEVV